MHVRTAEEQVRHVERPVSMQTRPGYGWLALFTVVYWSCTWALSRAKPLWFDELFTYYMARLAISDQISALRSGIETNPPGFPWLVGVSQALLGVSELTTRLPAMVSYYVFCVLLFVFVMRRLANPVAWVALVLPLGLSAYAFAYEARAYSLMLAAAMVAFLGWQNRLLRIAPRAGLVLIGLGTFAGILGHYFAVFMIVAPLGVAECARAWQRRRIDWAFWFTLAIAVSPLLWLAPLARAASHVFTDVVSSAPAFWARPTIIKLPAFFWTQMQGLLVPAGVALAIGLWLDRWPVGTDRQPSSAGLSKPEVWLMGALLAVPPLSLGFAWLSTGTYVHRYALTGVIGIVLGACWLLNYLRWTKASYALIAATTLVFVFNTGRASSKRFNVPLPPPAEETGLPLVISDPLRYLVLAHYRPSGMKAVPVYLTHRTAVTTLSDFVPEISLSQSRTLFPVDVRDYHEFTRTNARFYVEETGETTREWLPVQLRRDGFKLTPVSCVGTRTLLLAAREPG